MFTNCWAHDNTILVIDTETDTVADLIEVGYQPRSLAVDRHGKLWVVSEGSYEGGSYEESPALYRIDAATRRVEKAFRFRHGDRAHGACLDAGRDALYFINKDVWKMDVTSDRLPEQPFLDHAGTIYYGIAVDPLTSDVYVADAVDYQQPGVIHRFSARGERLDTFRVGIIPGAFCFKTE